MGGAFCIFIAALITIVIGLVIWLVRTELRERRKERFAAEMAAYHWKIRPELSTPEPEPEDGPLGQQVTVAELVARIEAERVAARKPSSIRRRQGELQ